jgi:hypothetical protein
MEINDQILFMNYSIHYKIGDEVNENFDWTPNTIGINEFLFNNKDEIFLKDNSIQNILIDVPKIEIVSESEETRTTFPNRKKRKGRPSKLDAIRSNRIVRKINNIKSARTYREKKMKVIKNLEKEVLKKYNYLPINILKNSNKLDRVTNETNSKIEFSEEKLLKMQEEMNKIEEEYMSKKMEFATEKEKKQFVNQISSAKYRIKKRYYIEHLVNLIN